MYNIRYNGQFNISWVVYNTKYTLCTIEHEKNSLKHIIAVYNVTCLFWYIMYVIFQLIWYGVIWFNLI